MTDDSTPQGPRAVDPSERDDLSAPLLDPADDAAIAALLATLPDLAMPDDVVARVAEALAAELPLSGAVPAWAAGGSTNVSVLPSQRERAARNARHTRVLSAAAAVVLVLGAVVLGTQFFQDSDLGTDTAGGNADQGAAAPETAAATLFTTSGAAYSATDIEAKTTGLVESASVAGAPLKSWDQVAPSESPSQVGVTESVRAFVGADGDFAALSVCLAKLSPGTGEKPVAVDIGTWSAKPAAVVVLSGTSPARVNVFVVTAACADPAVTDDSYLLYFATVARP